MKELKGSIFAHQNLLKGKEWYHQRFDGCPMFIFAIADAEMLKEKRKPAGNLPKLRVCFFGDGKADWHLDMSDVNVAKKSFLKLLKSNPNFSKKLMKAWKGDEQAFDRFYTHEFPKIKFEKLTDAQLLSAWKKYYALVLHRLSSTGIIDHFSLGTDGLVHDMLVEEVKAQTAGKTWKESELSGVFAAATAPVHQSFMTKAEIELMKIASRQSKETVEHYQQRYFWTKNNYVTSQVLSIEYFQREVKVWKQGKKNLKAEIVKLENTPKESKAKKQALLKQYKFSPLLKNFLKVSEDFTAWQDERKRATYLHIYMASAFLKEIAKRTGYSLDQLKYSTADEVESIFKKNTPSKKELDNRKKGSVFLALQNGYYVATAADVERVRKIMWGHAKQDEVKDFRGLTASLGKVTGKVRIIRSVDEIGRIKLGEILVAVMTRPDYIPAMKKAAAIVTDEGGVTSHAAIVSRELGTPCIIGTKIATKVLHDGDLVEVNANHGLVTILERS